MASLRSMSDLVCTGKLRFPARNRTANDVIQYWNSALKEFSISNPSWGKWTVQSAAVSQAINSVPDQTDTEAINAAVASAVDDALQGIDIIHDGRFGVCTQLLLTDGGTPIVSLSDANTGDPNNVTERADDSCVFWVDANKRYIQLGQDIKRHELETLGDATTKEALPEFLDYPYPLTFHTQHDTLNDNWATKEKPALFNVDGISYFSDWLISGYGNLIVDRRAKQYFQARHAASIDGIEAIRPEEDGLLTPTNDPYNGTGFIDSLADGTDMKLSSAYPVYYGGFTEAIFALSEYSYLETDTGFTVTDNQGLNPDTQQYLVAEDYRPRNADAVKGKDGFCVITQYLKSGEQRDTTTQDFDTIDYNDWYTEHPNVRLYIPNAPHLDTTLSSFYSGSLEAVLEIRKRPNVVDEDSRNLIIESGEIYEPVYASGSDQMYMRFQYADFLGSGDRAATITDTGGVGIIGKRLAIVEPICERMIMEYYQDNMEPEPVKECMERLLALESTRFVWRKDPLGGDGRGIDTFGDIADLTYDFLANGDLSGESAAVQAAAAAIVSNADNETAVNWGFTAERLAKAGRFVMSAKYQDTEIPTPAENTSRLAQDKDYATEAGLLPILWNVVRYLIQSLADDTTGASYATFRARMMEALTGIDPYNPFSDTDVPPSFSRELTDFEHYNLGSDVSFIAQS